MTRNGMEGIGSSFKVKISQVSNRMGDLHFPELMTHKMQSNSCRSTVTTIQRGQSASFKLVSENCSVTRCVCRWEGRCRQASDQTLWSKCKWKLCGCACAQLHCVLLYPCCRAEHHVESRGHRKVQTQTQPGVSSERRHHTDWCCWQVPSHVPLASISEVPKDLCQPS